MDTAETPQQTSGETGENRESNLGENAATKYVNGEVDNMPQQQCILTTITPLDVALQTPTSETTTPIPSAKQKRDSHNEIERRRKCKINIGIIKLGEIIPSCINAKLSKNQILEHAANHILELTAKCEKLLTSSASETQAEEIKNLMKENERLRSENKRFQELMKNLQIPPNGVANPAAFFKSKAKSLAQKGDAKVIPISKNNTNVKTVVTNPSGARVLPANQGVTILTSNNQIAGANQVGTNQVVNQGAPGVGNAILVQNPNGGYFLVPANKNVTIPIPSNQVAQSIAPNQIAVPTVVSSQTGTPTSITGQVVNSGDGSSQVTIGQTTMTTTSAGTTTVTTQAVSTPIASATPQGTAVQAPGMVQTIRYLVPMMPASGQGGQTSNQTVMVMAKPNNQPVPLRIAPQQPIRMAGTQPQVILPQPSGIPVSSSQSTDLTNGSKKKSSPPKIKNLCSTDSDSDTIKTETPAAGPTGLTSQPTAITPAPVGVQAIAPNPVTVATNQVVLQRPPVQTSSVVGNTVNQNVMTMQVMPKPVTQQLVYLQGQNGQLIPVMLQNPNAQGTTVIQQPAQQQQQQQAVGTSPNQTLVTIPINQNQGVINNRPVVVVSQPATMTSSTPSVITQASQNIQGTGASTMASSNGVITSVSNSHTAANTVMSPLTVLTSQNTTSGNTDSGGFSNSTNDILAKAAESIFSPNSLNDNSPTLNLNEMTDTGAATGASTSAIASTTASVGALAPFPIAIQRVDDPVTNFLRNGSQPEAISSLATPSPASAPVTEPHGKKQKKSKKKKKKKEKGKDKDKDKEKDKDKKKSKHKTENKEKINVKPAEEDNTIIKELDRGMANSIDALPDSTSGTAIITDTLLQEWIEKEAGLGNPDQDGENTEETITNVTASQDKKESEEIMDSSQGQSSTAIPSNYSAEALLSGSNDASQPTPSPPAPPQPPPQPSPPPPTTATATAPTTCSGNTPTTTATETTTSNSHNPFGSFPSFSFGSDILSSSMSVSGLPTYIEDEQSDDGKSTNNGLNSLKALGSMRDSILSFGSSQTGVSQTPTSQPPSDQPKNQTLDNTTDRSRSVSPVESLPMVSPTPPQRDSSPESTHGFSNSPGPPSLFGSGANLLSDNLEPKDSTQGQEEESSNDVPQSEPSPFPASHNSSWISHHSRASHLASGLKKQKAPAPPTSLPIPIPVSTPIPVTTSSTDSPINPTGPAGFYTLPWLSPVTSVNSRMTPTSQLSSSNTDSSQPEKPISIPTPTYLPTQRSSPSYVPNQHTSSASYVPPQRSSSPTYLPPHRSSPPSYLPKVTSQSSLSTSSPLTVDISVSHPIFSSSGQLNTPTSRSVITTSQLTTTVSTTNSSAKLKSRPSLKKFSPSTIHRTLTSGITEDSPEKADEEPKIEPRPQKEQQREWQHKLPMQVKPGPEIRTKESPVVNPIPQPGSLTIRIKPTKNKRHKKKQIPGATAGKEAPKEVTDADRANLEDIGKRELPKNLVDQFPWLAEAEGEKKAGQNQGHIDRSTSFSIQSITQQNSAKASTLVQKSTTAPSASRPQMVTPSTDSQSRITSNFTQNQGSSGPPFWNPSTTGSYPRSTESMTSTTTSTPSPAAPVVSMPSKSRIEYTPRQSPSFSPSVSVSSASSVTSNQSPVSLPNFGGSTNQRELQSPSSQTSQASDHQSSVNKGRKQAPQRKQGSGNQKQTQPSDSTSPLNSPADSSNSPLFPDFQLAPHLGITPNLLSNSSLDSRTTPTSMNQKQDSSSRMQISNQNSPLSHQPPRSSALPTQPPDNFLFSPSSSSGSSAQNPNSAFPNPGTNRSDNNQSEGDDPFMTLAQAEKSLDFLPNSPDQSQSVDPIDLSSLPMFDTPTSTPTSTQSSMQTSVQSTAQSQRQQVSGRASVERQPAYGQSPNHQPNMRPGHTSHQMYSMQNAGHRQVDTSSHIMTSHTQTSHTPVVSSAHNRFMPSPEMHHPNQGTKRPASENTHPVPSPKRTAGAMHHNQLSMPHLQGHEGQRGVVLERAPVQSSHIHRVDHGMHRGQTPPSTVAQQVGSPHSAPQHNRRPVERQTSSGSEIPRVPTYDLTQSVAHQRTRSTESVPSSRTNPHRVPPTYDLAQSVAPHRNRSVERQTSGSETHRIPNYDLTQGAGTQRTHAVERQTSVSETPRMSETQRIPTYNLTQGAGAQRTRSVERPTSGSEAQRTPVYDLSQSAGVQRNPVERHQASRSETQRVPTYDLSQNASAQRTRSTERPTSASETQRIPTYDLTQSPQRDPAPAKQRKRPQNNTEQYFPSSDNTSSLRHMDSSNIAQESNPWPGFPSQRMPSVPSSEPSLSSPPFLPNFASPSSQSLASSMSQSETVVTSSSASIVPSLSPSRRLRTDMPTYLPHPHLAPILSSPPQGSKSSIGREAEISTPFNPMFPTAHTRAGLGMNVPPNFPPVFHEHAHQHAPPPFNVAKAQLPGSVGVHPTFNFNNIFNDMPGPNTSHSDTPTGLPVHTMHLHGNPGMSVEDSMAHMRGNVPSRHVHGHPQAFGNNMRIDSLLGQNVSADGRTFKVGVPMGAPFHAASFGPGMPF